MATFLKSSTPGIACLTAGLLFALFLSSCTSTDKEDGVWIPVPKDTSALGRINHFIPLEEINSFTRAYTRERDTLSKNNPGLYIPVSEAFNKKGLIEILKDPQSVGIKIYYGVKPGKRNELRLIMVGVDAQGNDLYYTEGGSEAATQARGGGRGGSEYGQCVPPCN